MQTPRDISYTGNPTGGTTAYPAVLPAAHEATENSDNIFYRTIRTVMKKQLICLLASAGLLAAGCSTENAPETTGYGTLSVSCTADTSIDTAAGASGTPGSDPADEPVFVKGGTRLTVTGTARRQSPTGTGEGPEVTFSAQTLDATTPRTCHIITYDAKNAGSATLTITLGEDYTDTRTLDCEVNEGAIDDTEKK